MERHNVICIGQTGDVIVWGGRQEVDTPTGKKLTVVALSDPGSAAEVINRYYAPEFKLDLVVGFMDSVPSYSPLLIRSPKTRRTIPSVDVLPIEDLWHMAHGEVHTTERGEEIKTLSEAFEVPIGSNFWTKIRKIIRHPANLELLRFNTGGGLLDITANHSVYSKSADPKKNKLVDAASLNVGKQLSMINVGLREGEGGGDFERLREPLFVGGLDLAWFYGFFVAEGHAGVHNRRAYTVLANTNKELAELTKRIMESYFHVNVSITPKERGDCRETCWRVESNSTNLARYLRGMFYTRSGEKKIPRSILNTTSEVKLAFLRGYNDGDGSQPHKLDEFELFGTTSWCLAEGLLLLAEQVLHRQCSLYWDEQKPKFIQLYILKTENHPKSKEKDVIKKIAKVPYRGYLYDLETENHTFTTGIGRFRVHNSFGIEFLNDLRVPVIGWIPIDGNFTKMWAYYLRNFHKIVAYSHFGFGELQKWFPPTKIDYIPHGISEEFKPVDKDEVRGEFEEKYGIPKDAFLVVNVGANIGPRKELPQMMMTFKRFAEKHPDAYLFMHTNPFSPFPRGYDLIQWRAMLGMEKRIFFPSYDPIISPIPNALLARIYSAADVYWQNSVGEGFGLPQYEALACGTPVICPRNSAQTEVVEGNGPRRGWLVENVPEDMYVQIPVYVPQLTKYPVPNQRSALEKLEEAYNSPDLRKEYGGAGRSYIERYHSWASIIPKWFALLETVENEMILIKKLGEALKGP